MNFERESSKWIISAIDPYPVCEKRVMRNCTQIIKCKYWVPKDDLIFITGGRVKWIMTVADLRVS